MRDDPDAIGIGSSCNADRETLCVNEMLSLVRPINSGCPMSSRVQRVLQNLKAGCGHDSISCPVHKRDTFFTSEFDDAQTFVCPARDKDFRMVRSDRFFCVVRMFILPFVPRSEGIKIDRPMIFRKDRSIPKHEQEKQKGGTGT